jgi:prepilin-type N-terminal cleavage/methylation domain-containing protein
MGRGAGEVILARLRRDERGYTLVELLVVLAIFTTVVTALVSLFTSGAKAELDMNLRFQAQQNARLALDRMRRELHCASGITATPNTAVSSITVALPLQCPSSGGSAISVVYDASLVSANRYRIRRTVGGTTVVIADYIKTPSGNVFTYTPQSASSRALLHVNFVVNINPNEGWKDWHLVDDIVLRNTLRQ